MHISATRDSYKPKRLRRDGPRPALPSYLRKSPTARESHAYCKFDSSYAFAPTDNPFSPLGVIRGAGERVANDRHRRVKHASPARLATRRQAARDVKATYPATDVSDVAKPSEPVHRQNGRHDRAQTIASTDDLRWTPQAAGHFAVDGNTSLKNIEIGRPSQALVKWLKPSYLGYQRQHATIIPPPHAPVAAAQLESRLPRLDFARPVHTYATSILPALPLQLAIPAFGGFQDNRNGCELPAIAAAVEDKAMKVRPCITAPRCPTRLEGHGSAKSEESNMKIDPKQPTKHPLFAAACLPSLDAPARRLQDLETLITAINTPLPASAPDEIALAVGTDIVDFVVVTDEDSGLDDTWSDADWLSDDDHEVHWDNTVRQSNEWNVPW